MITGLVILGRTRLVTPLRLMIRVRNRVLISVGVRSGVSVRVGVRVKG